MNVISEIYRNPTFNKIPQYYESCTAIIVRGTDYSSSSMPSAHVFRKFLHRSVNSVGNPWSQISTFVNSMISGHETSESRIILT